MNWNVLKNYTIKVKITKKLPSKEDKKSKENNWRKKFFLRIMVKNPKVEKKYFKIVE